MGSPRSRRRVRRPVPLRGPGTDRGVDLEVVQLGVVPYAEALELQLRLRELRQADQIGDTLLLLEHPAVYTRGRRTEAHDLPMGEDWYRAQGIEIHDADRGGRVTYHGPGQLVGYPIMRISDVPAFVHTMEQAIVTALADEGITAAVLDGLTGIWANDAKIGSIGGHARRGGTAPGFAANGENDPQPLERVVPCGVAGAPVTTGGPG